MKVSVVYGLNAGDDSYEYEYDEAPKSKKTSGGSRLVGARTARKLEAPFAVAINPLGLVLSLTVSCSININAGNTSSLKAAQDL